MSAARRELIASWSRKADDLERTAKSYKGKCVKHKGVQNILLAKQLRKCVEELEKAIAADETESTGPAA